MKKQKKSNPKQKDLKAFSSRLVYVLIAVFGFILYSPSLKYEWALDDLSAIKENYVTKKGFAGISTHLTESYRYGYWNSKGTLYRPLPLVLFAAEWGIAPDSPGIHHFFNVLLYALLCLLIYIFLVALLKSQFWSFLITILFVVHPVHVEVVANIKSRDEILSMLFGIFALYSWWKYLGPKKMMNLLLALFSLSLAMFSKESSITFFALFPVLSIIKHKGFNQKELLQTLLFVIPILVYLFVRSKILGDSGIEGLQSSPLDNLLFAAVNSGQTLAAKATAILILGKYAITQLIPFQLGSDFGFNQIPIVGFSDWRVLLSFIFHAGLIFIVFKFWKKNWWLSFGAFFYLATISIFSNLVIYIGSSYGERFLFIPSLGFIIMGIALLRSFVEKNGTPIKAIRWNQQTKIPILLTAAFAIFFTYKTLTRMPAWENSYTLYSTDILTAPNSAKLNYHFGLENAKQGRDTKNANEKQKVNSIAKKHFEKAIAVYPKYSDAYSQLGLLSYRTGDNQSALNHYKKALEINPKKSLVYSNMGIIYFNAGKLNEAEAVYKKALELDPRFADAYQNLGAVYARQKKFDLAIANFEKGLSFDPNNKNLNFYMGSALKDAGRAGESGPYLRKAK